MKNGGLTKNKWEIVGYHKQTWGFNQKFGEMSEFWHVNTLRMGDLCGSC